MSTSKPALAPATTIRPLPHTRTDSVGLPVWDVAGMTITLGTVDSGRGRGQVGIDVRVGRTMTPDEITDVAGALAGAVAAAQQQQRIEEELEVRAAEAEELAAVCSEDDLLDALADASKVGLDGDEDLLRDALDRRRARRERREHLHLVPDGAA